MMPFYSSPFEAQSAAQGETDAALAWVVYKLQDYLEQKVDIREQLEVADDDETGDLEWKLKLIRNEEASLQKIGSMLQSRLRVG